MNTQHLKRKILDLAFRGKLVPQDANDEPTSLLLKRIQEERQQLAAQGKIKLKKKKNSKKEQAQPYDIPNGWEWVTLDDVIIVIGGQNQKDVADENGEYPIYGSGGIMGYANDYLCPENCTIIGRKGTINNPIFVTTKFWNVDTAFGLCPDNNISALFLFYFCNWFDFTSIERSTTLPSLTKTNIEKVNFPLPPFTEQLRIVETVEKCYALIDDIDANKKDLQDCIKHTKRKILDLAINGKLVEQDTKEEPAINLLKRINKNFKLNDTIQDLPNGWCPCTFKDIFEITMGSSPKGNTLNNDKDGVEFHQGKTFFTNKYLNESDTYTKEPTKLAKTNSVLLCVRAPVGIVNITEREICIGRGLSALYPKPGIDMLFAYYALQTYQPHFENIACGTTFNAIGRDDIKNEKFLLPPEQEQVRIRKKIEEAFELLDATTAEL